MSDSGNKHLVGPLRRMKTTPYFLLEKGNNPANPIPSMIYLSFMRTESGALERNTDMDSYSTFTHLTYRCPLFIPLNDSLRTCCYLAWL